MIKVWEFLVQMTVGLCIHNIRVQEETANVEIAVQEDSKTFSFKGRGTSN